MKCYVIVIKRYVYLFIFKIICVYLNIIKCINFEFTYYIVSNILLENSKTMNIDTFFTTFIGDLTSYYIYVIIL